MIFDIDAANRDPAVYPRTDDFDTELPAARQALIERLPPTSRWISDTPKLPPSQAKSAPRYGGPTCCA
jgi:cytochrome P450